MIHQGTPELWMRELPAQQFCNSGWQNQKGDLSTQHFRTLQAEIARSNTIRHNPLELRLREHNTYVFRKPSESPRKLVVCHDLFPLSFSRIPLDRLHPHAYFMYRVTKWNLHWNVKSKSEITSYMKWLVARFTTYPSVCMYYKCSRHKIFFKKAKT